jgi:hypothetical protein
MNTLREIGEFVGLTPNTSLRAVGDIVRFVTDEHTSMRGIIRALETVDFSVAQSTRPLYRRSRPRAHDTAKIDSTTDHIDLSDVAVHLPPFDEKDAEVPYTVTEAARRFEARAAATVSAATGFGNGVSLFPSVDPDKDLLEEKSFGDVAPTIFIPTAKCLAALAYSDFFPDAHAEGLRPLVSQAILAASSGWCGTFGPAVNDTLAFLAAALSGEISEGNYDMSQMHLLHMAYAYYDELTEPAREHLIRVLLASGRLRRVNIDDVVTSGRVPNDWPRAGFLKLGIVNVKRIGETENHILTIHTARYLTNQLLYQRDHHPDHDNRRNSSEDAPSCTELMLFLLRNILRDDFSEYNSKNYQNEVREALLNLCNFSYDHEVRLGARMVLDYISAHIAVSTNDLRRMVPFRRLNKGQHSRRTAEGYMDVGLLETNVGADPMTPHFAILAGNTRAYQTGTANRRNDWSISTAGGNGHDAVADALSDYRLPVSIHDLFVTDRHRRFYQRLHRVPQDDPEVTGRNCDNHEVYAGSPSYLITAGGSPADFAIDPRFLGIVARGQDQQLGVAVTTSFMPTGTSGGALDRSIELIQFSSFSQEPGQAVNYGVAPDFACGHQVHLPEWCSSVIEAAGGGKFGFVNKSGPDGHPGFYLAFLTDGQLTAMEAFDTWLHPEVTFQQFKDNVLDKNRDLNSNGLQSNVEADYTTHNGNRVTFVIWNELDGDDKKFGARVVRMAYGDGDPADRVGDAGNPTDQFLRGTVLNSGADGVVEITNHFLGTKLTLDMHDQAHPKRTGETDEVEEAGSNQEVWVNLAWKGPTEGDFFHPFNTMAAAVAAVAPGGVIKMMPGTAS